MTSMWQRFLLFIAVAVAGIIAVGLLAQFSAPHLGTRIFLLW